MNNSSSSQRRCASHTERRCAAHTVALAFTLIELLVVISIIAVLAGLLLPVIGKVMQNAHKADAKSTVMQLVAAVKNYQTEYGQYPVVAPAAGATPTDTTYDRTTHNATLLNVLRNSPGIDPTLNTRHIVYFEGKDVKNPSSPHGGFIPATTASATGNLNVSLNTGDLVDPWGNLFYIRIDTDYSDMVSQPYPATDSGSGAISYSNPATDNGNTGAPDLTKVLRFGVVAWSPGQDGKMGDNGTTGSAAAVNYGDDVVSWQ